MQQGPTVEQTCSRGSPDPNIEGPSEMLHRRTVKVGLLDDEKQPLPCPSVPKPSQSVQSVISPLNRKTDLFTEDFERSLSSSSDFQPEEMGINCPGAMTVQFGIEETGATETRVKTLSLTQPTQKAAGDEQCQTGEKLKEGTGGEGRSILAKGKGKKGENRGVLKNLKIATMDVRGLKDEDKFEGFKQLLFDLEVDVGIITETHMTHVEMDKLTLPGYRVEHGDGRPDSASGRGGCSGSCGWGGVYQIR